MRILPFVFLTAILFLSCDEQSVVNTPPITYYLNQNFPNPFTDTTRIEYGVPQVPQGGASPWLRMIVYDRFNIKQALLMEDATHAAGTFSVTWNGRGVNAVKVPAGLYYIELQQLNGSRQQGEGNVLALLRIIALKQ
jgi:hypothetical protein